MDRSASAHVQNRSRDIVAGSGSFRATPRDTNGALLDNGHGGKKEIRIVLSGNSMRAFEELKIGTDARTDTEVFRKALLLHLTFLRAHAAGAKVFVKRGQDGEITPITLFSKTQRSRATSGTDTGAS